MKATDPTSGCHTYCLYARPLGHARSSSSFTFATNHLQLILAGDMVRLASVPRPNVTNAISDDRKAIFIVYKASNVGRADGPKQT